MLKLADAAAALHDDDATRSYLNWVRRLPEDARVPSPLRVSSYCLNNAATRILQRLYLGQIEGDDWLARAGDAIATMHQRDAGFRLLKATWAIQHTVTAHLTGDTSGVDAFFAEMVAPQCDLSGDPVD